MVIGQKRHETKTDKRFYAGRPVDESFVRLYPPSPVWGRVYALFSGLHLDAELVLEDFKLLQT